MIIIRTNENSSPAKGRNFPKFALSCKPLASFVFDSLIEPLKQYRGDEPVIALPRQWPISSSDVTCKLVRYENSENILEILEQQVKGEWVVISDGLFHAQPNVKLLEELLNSDNIDVLALSVEPKLTGYHEKILFTSENNIAGWRRLYTDSMSPSPVSKDWPHHLLIRSEVLKNSLSTFPVTGNFSDFLDLCKEKSLLVHFFKIAGASYDLREPEGLLTLLNKMPESKSKGSSFKFSGSKNNSKISSDAKLTGNIILGTNIIIESEAVLIGPTIIGDNVKISRGAVIHSSIISEGISIPSGKYIRNSLVTRSSEDSGKLEYNHSDNYQNQFLRETLSKQKSFSYRNWRKLSYPRYLKRLADIIFSVIVIFLFAPIIPFIILAIKLNSHGPVFFKTPRQGLNGEDFLCIKFRTMRADADEIQDKLRSINQIDGPQFMIKDDPRVTTVGKFLRETYIDEIPQFLNVLLGQMSVVGPRPSPDCENTLCPAWRDIRLSVRPGITGYWQMERTREPSRDFQEWIHYDTKYVQRLSLKTDLWICWKTFKKMTEKFFAQF